MTNDTAAPSRTPITKVDVGSADFERVVIDQSHRRPVVVDFWAPWCGPCRMLGPVLEKLAAEDGGAWLLAKVNSDDHPELAQRFGVSGIPAVKAIVAGEVVDAFVGALPPPQVRAWLTGIVPSQSDKLVDLGEQALRAGDLPAAQRAFDAALALDDGHARARLGQAALAIHLGELDRAEALLAALPADARSRHELPLAAFRLQIAAGRAGDGDSLRARLEADADDHDARIALGKQHAAANDWTAAFGAWLEVVRRDHGAAREAARKAMVEGFAVCPDATLIKTWRGMLSMELFV